MAGVLKGLATNGISAIPVLGKDQQRVLGQPIITTAREQIFKFNDWTVTISKGPILSSQCSGSVVSDAAVATTSGSEDSKPENDNRGCQKCSFCSKFSVNVRSDGFWSYPSAAMAVGSAVSEDKDNRIRVENTCGKYGVEFNALDGVNSVASEPSTNIKVASAGVWQQSRSEALKLYGVNSVQYDWTYSPRYQGTLFGGMRTEDTTEVLDLEMLKRKDPVLLFDEVQLYGDELDDNGCAELDVKIRIVSAYLFVLMRFYLRVDHVFVRLIDTRLTLEAGKNYCLRECSVRECRIPELPIGVSPMDPNQIWSSLHPANVVIARVLPPSEAIYY